MATKFPTAPALAAAMVTASTPTSAAEDPPLRLHAIEAFAHAPAQPPPAAQRHYARQFPAATTRHLSVQVTFENPGGDAAPAAASHNLTLSLYDFENQLLCAHRHELEVPGDWRFVWATQSYGWPEPGRWSPGTYRVQAWLGDTKAGETTFFLTGDGDADAGRAGAGSVALQSLELFEGGSFFRPDGSPAAPRRAADAPAFARADTRRIFWVLRGTNLLHQIRPHRPNIVGYYYRPDGSLLGEAANRFLIAPEVSEVVLVEGFGWPTRGNWPPGRYRFELEQDHRVVAERSFEITAGDRQPSRPPGAAEPPASPLPAVLAASAFPGDADPPPALPASEQRPHVAAFPASRTTFIWTELVLAVAAGTAPRSHTITWQYLSPDGSELGRAVTTLDVEPGWRTARQQACLGWAEPGRWPHGAYKVRVAIDGNLARVVRFEVTG